MRADAQALEYSVGKRTKRATLLTGVSGALYPGQLLALVHPHALIPRMHAALGFKCFSSLGSIWVPVCAYHRALHADGPQRQWQDNFAGCASPALRVALLLTEIRCAAVVPDLCLQTGGVSRPQELRGSQSMEWNLARLPRTPAATRMLATRSWLVV